MKKILIFGFVLLSLTTQAQLDSSTIIRARDRKSLYNKDTGVPSWLIDGYRAIIVDGDTLLRSNVGNWYASELSIYPDGTDQTTKLNADFATTFVNSIHFTSDSAREFRVSDSVTAHGKTIIFGNGCRLTGDANIDSLTFDAGDFDYVFGDSLTFTNPRAARGHVTPQNFGAVADGVTDCTEAVQLAASMPNVTLYFPPGIYYTSDSITVSYTKSVFMHPNALIMSYTTDRPAIIIGTYSDDDLLELRDKEYTLYVERGTQSDWTDTLSVGVKAVNINYSPKVAILRANNFTIGAHTIGYNAGLAYTDYQLGVFQNNKIGLKITTQNAGELSWNNQNNYKSGWFRKNASVNPGEQAFGIWVGNGSYFVTNNFFDGASFEDLGDNSIPIYIESGSRNQFINFRSEGNSDTVVYVAKSYTSNKNNNFYAARDGGTGFLYDLGATGTNQYTSAERISYAKSNYTTIAELDNITERCVYNGTDSTVNIAYPGLFMARTGTSFPTNNIKATLIDDYMLIESGFLYGLATNIIDVSILKRIVVKQFSIPGNEARLTINLFDDNMQNISDTGLMKSEYSQTNTSTYGGAVILNTDDKDIAITFPDEVKKVRIIFTRNSVDVKIKGYKITAYDAGSAPTYAFTNDRTRPENIASAIPTIGSYTKGKIIYNSDPNDDSARGWICSASGTFGTSPSTTITMANNQIYAVLGSGGGDSVQVGQWLDLNGHPTQIIGVSNDTVFLGDRTYGTLSGAALTYATPAFIDLSGGGGLTSGDVAAQIHDSLDAAATVDIVNGAPDLSNDTLAAIYGGNTVIKTLITGTGMTTRTDTTITFVNDGGSYTPTFADYNNISSTTASSATYSRNGNIVTIFMSFSATATSAGGANTTLTATIPSGLTLTSTMSGHGTVSTGTDNETNVVCSYSSGTKFSIQYFAPVNTSTTIRLSIQYSL